MMTVEVALNLVNLITILFEIVVSPYDMER
jgi:hypothetical protein